MALFFICIILEFIAKNKPIVRSIFFFLALLLIVGCSITKNINLGAECIILFCIPYSIILLIVIIRKPVFISNTADNPKFINNKTFPEGIFDKKILIANYAFFAAFILVVIALDVTLNHFNINLAWSLLIILIVIIVLIVLNQLLNSLRKTLNLINKELNYEGF